MEKYRAARISRRIFVKSLLPLVIIGCSKGEDESAPPDSGNNDPGEIPDKTGMTVKGRVYHGDQGVPNVVVSDGVVVTRTDKDGIYYLPSDKTNRYVFISIPGNYEVAAEKGLPKFFHRLSLSTDEVETKHFELTPVDNTNHVVVVATDFHLAGRNNDVEQYRSGFLRDANGVIESNKAKGAKVYGLTLGDLTWDSYWYDNNYFLDDFLPELAKLNTTIFNIMGNHDNDPYFADDHAAEHAFRELVGPTYYSFNLGQVHYVVLDNIEYVNEGGSPGSIGDRSYNAKVVRAQMEWLKKDLAMVSKDTPIMVAMHIQLNGRPTLNLAGIPSSTFRLEDAPEFIDAFNGFSRVHILTGHTHCNHAWENSPAIMEHNTAAVCATWWWTGRADYSGKHICRDGSPGGYTVWNMEGKDIKWKYKSIGYDADYQFRAYDLNECHITPEAFAPNVTADALRHYAGEYAEQNNRNEVLINVWGFDEQWKVAVTENGAPLQVTRVEVKDPLHIISYEALRLNKGATPTSGFVTAKTSHMFKVTASNATNTLEIKVTDRFGRAYTEQMERPKALAYSMR